MPHDTSILALASVKPLVNNLQRRILDALEFEPRTCYELCKDLDLRTQTVSARLNELFNKGLIHDVGARRPTDSGRLACVWHAVK